MGTMGIFDEFKEDARALIDLIKERKSDNRSVSQVAKKYKCKKSEVATSEEEVGPKTVVLMGTLAMGESANEFPPKLEHITGGLLINNSPIKSLGNLKTVRYAIIAGTELTDLGNITEMSGGLSLTGMEPKYDHVSGKTSQAIPVPNISSLGPNLKAIGGANFEAVTFDDWGSVEKITGEVHLLSHQDGLIDGLVGMDFSGTLYIDRREVPYTRVGEKVTAIAGRANPQQPMQFGYRN